MRSRAGHAARNSARGALDRSRHGKIFSIAGAWPARAM